MEAYKKGWDVLLGFNKDVQRYNEKSVVCPPKLKRGLFCTSALDNIDHNPSFTTANTSFHGTSISIFNHKVKKGPEVPDYYTNVHPAFFTKKNPSTSKINLTYESLPDLCRPANLCTCHASPVALALPVW